MTNEPGADGWIASGHPLGPSIGSGGTGFSLWSPQATNVDLLLFDGIDDVAPTASIPLDPATSWTRGYWSATVPGIGHGQVYGYRVSGPSMPADGLLFDPANLLLDPYGRGVAVPDGYTRARPADEERTARAMKSVLVDLGRYDWEGDRPLRRPPGESVVYEVHVGAFTAHPSSGVAAELRGTYRGFIERIPYLVDLGVTAVELLPVFHFDRLAALPGRTNVWGYQPVAFFAPHLGYASRPDPLVAADELRDLIKALHRAGLEVILDVVYNHTAEAGPDGPTFGFRGFANDDYYVLGADRSTYVDVTGCGNTFQAGSPVVRRLILDSLRFWVSEYHVDGFRFDLAAVLSRDAEGRPLAHPATILDIDTDPVLAGTKLIAEAWDAGGLYQVGTFGGDRWAEWNGRFRDDVRAFVKGEDGYAASVAQRLMGSPDLYGPRLREPQLSVNFVTCHDGFTLDDLVSYDRKHNDANGEDNRDGSDDNRSWNCGAEGPTDDPGILELRSRQVRNLLAITLLAPGMPMLLMGDEVRRTQAGNNNAWSNDDESTWFDWDAVEREAGLRRFVSGLIRARRTIRTVLGVEAGVPLADLLRSADVRPSGARYGQPDLSQDSHSIAVSVTAEPGSLYLIVNAWWEPLAFELPPRPGRDAWRCIIDTALPSPDDLRTYPEAPAVGGPSRDVAPRSTVLLAARGDR